MIEVDIILDGLGEDEEEYPGAFIGFKKRKPLVLKAEPKSASGTVLLSLSTGLDLYDAEANGNLVTNREWSINSIPTNLYVEGAMSSNSVRDKECRLTYKSFFDIAKATVVSVNIATNDTTEMTEESPGTFIAINSTTNVTISYAPSNLDCGELELSGGSGKLEFSDGTTQLTNMKWNLANSMVAGQSVPSMITVKGIDHGEVEYLTLQHDVSRAEDKLKVTVYELILEAPGKMVELSPGIFRVPIMLNDNRDCGMEYTASWNCATNCSGGTTCDHRELEPVWDMKYIGSYSDPDLVQLKLEMKPNTMPGDVELKIVTGGTRVRLWQQASKGNQSDIISVSQTYAVSDLPKEVYAEGIDIGDVLFEAEYKPPQNVPVNATKSLSASVVSLIEQQVGTRKIINQNGVDIDFTVDGGSGFNGKYAWTVPNYSTTLPAIGSNGSIAVSYGATGYSVIVPEDAANRRFTTTVSVSLDGKLTMSKIIRVAQATYQGTAVAANTPASARRTEVPGLATPPAGFDNTESSGTFSQAWFETNYTGSSSPNDPVQTIDSQRLQYAPNRLGAGAYGAESMNSALGANRKVYGVFVLPDAYIAGFAQEDLAAIAEHECQHARQDIAVRTGGNDWRELDDYYGNAMSYSNFAEADSQLIELVSDASWRFMTIGDSFTLFLDEYGNNTRGAVQQCNGMASGSKEKKAAKAILQSVYIAIPFEEMKRHDYDFYTRPPL